MMDSVCRRPRTNLAFVFVHPPFFSQQIRLSFRLSRHGLPIERGVVMDHMTALTMKHQHMTGAL